MRVTQEQEQKALQYQPTFAQKKGMFFGVHFGNGKINITVLDSITAYKEEGTAMQHCVYRNQYYKENSSLILSAKDQDGNRLATIELSLKNWEVLQCRGKMNSVPKYYDEIVSLVKNNVKLFKQAKRQMREKLALAS